MSTASGGETLARSSKDVSEKFEAGEVVPLGVVGSEADDVDSELVRCLGNNMAKIVGSVQY